MAAIGSALGMNIFFSARPGEIKNERDGIDRLPLEELLPSADVISLHCPLTDSTTAMINAKALNLMKPTALLINCSRGGLIDETALTDALLNQKIGGAGLDVLSHEPPQDNNPLLGKNIPNLIITPLCAWGSRESRQTLVDITSENVRQFLNGSPQNTVSP